VLAVAREGEGLDAGPDPQRRQARQRRHRRDLQGQQLAPQEHPAGDDPLRAQQADGGAQIDARAGAQAQAGSGPALPIGNTGLPTKHDQGAPAAQPLPAPVQAYEVTTMPLPQGRCSGRYTEEARKAGVEGTVVLDLVVGQDGRVREVRVVSGLDHGLTEAAIAAAKECRFSPGEKDGTPVPVRVRGFKIRFLLDGAE
jgi:TonB family protein